MSPIELPAEIQLVEKRETRTSRGMLSKGWYRVDDRLVMVKGNSITEAGTAEELTDTKLRYQFDKSKPFRSRHAQQIKLLDAPVLPVRDLDTLYTEIIQAISPILALLSEKRASAIRQYLKYRLHYLKVAMG